MKCLTKVGLLLTLLVTPVMGVGQPPDGGVFFETEEPQREAPFASEIAAFETADKRQMPPKDGVLFIGSSSIRLWSTLAQDFPELLVINRGFGGSQIYQSTHYAKRIVFPYRAKMIVMYAGGNDLNAGKTPSQILRDFKAFVKTVHRKQPDTRIAYISINPSIARWKQEAKVLEANRLIRKYIEENASAKRKLSFLSSHERLLSADGQPRPEILQQDGLHLNPQGYKEWLAILKPQILALWDAET